MSSTADRGVRAATNYGEIPMPGAPAGGSGDALPPGRHRASLLTRAFAFRRPALSRRVDDSFAVSDGVPEGGSFIGELPGEARLRRRASFKQAVVGVLDSLPYQLVLLLFILYCLFAQDIVSYVSAPDSVDPWINAFLIAAMAMFAVEIALGCLCRPRLVPLALFLDVVATASILVDITWFSDAVGLERSGQTNHAARAIRILRLVRAVDILRMLTEALARLVLLVQPGPADRLAPSAIGRALLEATTLQTAAAVVATIIGSVLITLGTGLPSSLWAYAPVFGALVGAPRAQLQPLVGGMQAFAAANATGQVPLALAVGAEAWSWAPALGTFTRRSSDRLVITAEGVLLEVDISGANRKDALLSMMLIVLILGVLVLFLLANHLTLQKTLVRPLDRIFASIRTNAAEIFKALDVDDGQGGGGGGPGSPRGAGAGAGGDLGEMNTIEAAVLKMSKIVAHFTGGGGQGAAMVKSMAEGADQSTKQWLATMVPTMGTGAEPAPEEATGAAADAALATKKGGAAEAALASPPGFMIKSAPSGRPRVTPNARSSVAAFLSRASSKPGHSGGPSPPAPALQGSPEPRPRLQRQSNLVRFMQRHAAAAGVAEAGDISEAREGGAGERLVEGLTPAQRQALADLDLGLIHSFQLDVLAVPPPGLVPLICGMFLDLDLAYFPKLQDEGEGEAQPQPGFVSISVLWAFVEEVSRVYRDVPYHNFWHCADVTHTAFMLARRVGPKVQLTPTESFALMVAAMCHDLDHPGVNNAYLVATRHGLATTYNDTSVLENRHVSCLYALVASHPDLDIFGELDPGTWREVRKWVIAAVLHTDMVHHFPMVSQLEVFYELHAAEIAAANRAARRGRSRRSDGSPSAPAASPPGPAGRVFTTPDDRQALLSLLVHCADISNPVKPGPIAEKWADRVLAEFFAQGDAERDAGLPVSPMCDRGTTGRAASQINFIEFVVAPLYAQVVRVFPELWELAGNLVSNRRAWGEVLLRELELDRGRSLAEKLAETHKAEARLAAFLEKHSAAFAPPRGLSRLAGALSDASGMGRGSSASITVASSNGSRSTEGGPTSRKASGVGSSLAPGRLSYLSHLAPPRATASSDASHLTGSGEGAGDDAV